MHNQPSDLHARLLCSAHIKKGRCRFGAKVLVIIAFVSFCTAVYYFTYDNNGPIWFHKDFKPALSNSEYERLFILLKNFHQFARDMNITYAIGDGSLLGYLRFQSMIPWDDDFDVHVIDIDERSFYDRFHRWILRRTGQDDKRRAPNPNKFTNEENSTLTDGQISLVWAYKHNYKPFKLFHTHDRPQPNITRAWNWPFIDIFVLRTVEGWNEEYWKEDIRLKKDDIKPVFSTQYFRRDANNPAHVLESISVNVPRRPVEIMRQHRYFKASQCRSNAYDHRLDKQHKRRVVLDCNALRGMYPFIRVNYDTADM